MRRIEPGVATAEAEADLGHSRAIAAVVRGPVERRVQIRHDLSIRGLEDHLPHDLLVSVILGKSGLRK